jgi:hypothetical protein
LRFPARVAVPTGETGVTLLEGILGLEASCNEPDDEDSKLNLKREKRDGVEGAVTLNVVTDAEKDLRCLPRLLAGDGEKAALPRKLMLSMDTWNRVASPELSVSMSSRKPSTETYILLEGIGFFVLYLFELKYAWTGRMESVRLLL